ncbi:LOW QUALITY PROTEIN: DNA-binding protein D-ETS-4-like [Palaemon carinicauda]|uniref:LOW QUALITY PROTEIN: DNA-binding protein D-ETS-4-like n=1 Tax=Palaemon carinicauda TaxID=392227 RepID=UPI0035B61BAA
MMHTLLYAEMNQAVPGAPTSLSPGHEGGYGECQVPSPSQWSDPCYSPQSFHSPQHLPVELEKVKEEPFSYLTLPASPPHLSPSSAPPSANPSLHGVSPYGRPPSGAGHVIKKDPYESSINLSDLLNENQTLVQQHQAPSSPPYGGGPYPDHPLLRGRLEETNAFQKISTGGSTPPPPFEQASLHHLPQPSLPLDEQGQAAYHQKMAPNGGYKESDEGLSFLESLVDVKRELEDDVSVGSSCGSPAAPSSGCGSPLDGVPASPPQQQQQQPQGTSASCQRDILETVERLAQEHNRRDVQRVSDSLNIPVDPALWSVDDVRAWLKLQASQLNLPPLMLDFWNYAGPSLLKLTEQQFRLLAPVGGELLYAKLEIWREALRSSPKFLPSPPPAGAIADPRHHHLQQQQQAGGAPSFLQHPHHQQVVDAGNNLMLLTAHHAHHQLQQHQASASGPAAPPPQGSSTGGSGSSSSGSAPASPPLPLVPTPVAQVNQQGGNSSGGAGGASPNPPSPLQQQGTAVYLDESCMDVAALLQQQQQQHSPSNSGSPQGGVSSPLGGHHHHTSANRGCSPQEDAYDSEEEVEEETCSSGGSGRGGTHIHLWQFLKELLQQPQLYGSCIRWLDRQKGVFKIEDSVRVARLWGKRKNRPAMNYDKLSRSIRQYYKKGIMKKTERSQRLVYQFCHPYCL